MFPHRRDRYLTPARRTPATRKTAAAALAERLYVPRVTGSAPSPLSAISLDPRGYATAAPPAEPSLVTPPQELPAQYTSLISGSPRSSFLPYGQGDPTSTWANVEQQIVKEAPADGWHVSFRYGVPPDSEFALAAHGPVTRWMTDLGEIMRVAGAGCNIFTIMRL